VIGINHLRGHLAQRRSGRETSRTSGDRVARFGGHTFLARMESLTSIQLLGSTRDDSVGEAYDKVARLLGLGFPGGPAVDKLAKTGTPSIPFPRPMLNEGFEFSFSGLKSAVGRFLDKNPRWTMQMLRRRL
jgi:N6-L-threonylcarbamoyladenine synthase